MSNVKSDLPFISKYYFWFVCFFLCLFCCLCATSLFVYSGSMCLGAWLEREIRMEGVGLFN